MTVISRTERSSKRAGMDSFSEIIGISPVAGMIHPRSDGSPRGRHSFGAGDSRSLPWAMNTQLSELFPLPFPSSQPASALARGRKHIDPGPDFGGGATMKMLMGPEVVIDRSNLLQGSITRGRIIDRIVHQQLFQGSDQAFDTAVLPRAARLAVLQANARTPQSQTKRPRREHRFVIRAQHAWAAILTTGGDEIVPDRPRRLVCQPLDSQDSCCPLFLFAVLGLVAR